MRSNCAVWQEIQHPAQYAHAIALHAGWLCDRAHRLNSGIRRGIGGLFKQFNASLAGRASRTFDAIANLILHPPTSTYLIGKKVQPAGSAVILAGMPESSIQGWQILSFHIKHLRN